VFAASRFSATTPLPRVFRDAVSLFMFLTLLFIGIVDSFASFFLLFQLGPYCDFSIFDPPQPLIPESVMCFLALDFFAPFPPPTQAFPAPFQVFFRSSPLKRPGLFSFFFFARVVPFSFVPFARLFVVLVVTVHWFCLTFLFCSLFSFSGVILFPWSIQGEGPLSLFLFFNYMVPVLSDVFFL